MFFNFVLTIALIERDAEQGLPSCLVICAMKDKDGAWNFSTAEIHGSSNRPYEERESLIPLPIRELTESGRVTATKWIQAHHKRALTLLAHARNSDFLPTGVNHGFALTQNEYEFLRKTIEGN